MSRTLFALLTLAFSSCEGLLWSGGAPTNKDDSFYHSFTNCHHRGELVHLCNKLGLHGNAAEIGVFHAGFSRHNLLNGHFSKYYMIDAWQFRPNQTVGGALSIDKNERSAKVHDKDYAIALNATRPWIASGRAVAMRMYSETACHSFPDNFFDFIYVDAAHEYAHVARDLRMWWPKLKKGGMMAGDDFVDTHDLLPSKTDHRGSNKMGGWGVKSAVVHFSEEVHSPFFLTFAEKEKASTETMPWLDERDPRSEWSGNFDKYAKRLAKADIPHAVRSSQLYQAWYMFK